VHLIPSSQGPACPAERSLGCKYI